MDDSGEVVVDEIATAEILNDYFGSVFTEEDAIIYQIQ